METDLKDIYQLKEDFDKVNSSDNLAYIRFYENNQESIENIDITKNEEHYDSKLRLFSEYGISLVGGGFYTKGASVLAEAIPMFENAPNQDFDELKEISYFEHLLWCYGIALWETKQLNDSIKIFDRLVDYYPDNDKYRKWRNQLKANKISKITTPLWIICLIWLLGELTLFEQFESMTRFKLSLIGFILLLTVSFFEYYKYLTKNKKNTNAQQRL